MKKEHITIIGAGLAGSLLAIYLAKKGFRVSVYERRPDMRRETISAGRSINLALSTRGIHALQEVGLADKILGQAIPMKGRKVHTTDGELTFQPYGKRGNEVINSTSRGDLNQILMDAAEEYEDVYFYFDQFCTGVDFSTGEAQFRNERSGEYITVAAQPLIACDGASSAVRMEMQKVGRFNLSQSYLEHGYKELSIPAGSGGYFQIEKTALHIWPRHTFMLIALPNLDGSFTCTLFLPFNGKHSFAGLSSQNKVNRFFKEQFPDAFTLMPTLEEEFFGKPTGSLVTIKCFPWHLADKALLLGDAAHAIVPFYGQGMNCAFEDCTLLNSYIEKYGPEWQKVFAKYEKSRKADTDAIADLALENFVEMRDKVLDPKFVLKKQLELKLEQKFPGKYFSKYTMVTFHRLPYSKAKRKGERQDKILMEMCESINDLAEVDLDRVYSKLKTLKK